MLSVQTYVETCTAHRLMGYDGRCRHLHGHNYKWEAAVYGLAQEEVQMRTGILLDFSELKNVLTKLTDIFDHATVLRFDDPLVKALQDTDRLIVLNANPTAENLAWLVSSQLFHAFNRMTVLTVYETSKCHASYSFRRGEECPIEIVGVYNV